MLEFWNRKLTKARKAHTCDECGTIITPGLEYYYEAGKNEDGFYTFKTCLECAKLSSVIDMEPDSCYNLQDAISASYVSADPEARGAHCNLKADVEWLYRDCEGKWRLDEEAYKRNHLELSNA